jgi:hypothetical protein
VHFRLLVNSIINKIRSKKLRSKVSETDWIQDEDNSRNRKDESEDINDVRHLRARPHGD